MNWDRVCKGNYTNFTAAPPLPAIKKKFEHAPPGPTLFRATGKRLKSKSGDKI